MFYDLALVGAGLVALYFGGEWLIAGSAGLALRFGMPSLLIGLTIVAYGTSAPELVVCIQAARSGHGEIALGNVIGSNIANIGLILGASCVVRPAEVDGELWKRELPVLFVSAALLIITMLDGHMGRLESAALLAFAVLYLASLVRVSRRKAVQDAAASAAKTTIHAAVQSGAPHGHSLPKLALLTLVGLGVLVGGGHVFVEGATALAKAWGVSERVVGLTIVAVGTSLPEFATSMIAAQRGHSGIAVGNVIGSNVFNALVCMSAAGLAGRLDAPFASVSFDLGIMLTMTVLAIALMRRRRVIGRTEGFVLVASYAGYLGWLLTHPRV